MIRFGLTRAQKRIIDTDKVYLSDIIAGLSQYGFPVEIKDGKHFTATLQAKLKDEQAVKYLVGILAYQRGEEAEPLFRNRVDNRFTSDVLLRPGFRWPLITETCYFDLTAKGA